MSLIGGTLITTISGPVSDRLGRRPMLILSSILFFLSGLIMSWTPNVYVLLVARLLDGFGTGLAVTLVPVYISETAPSDIRGTLNTLPQFTGSGGMFLSYCMVFGMSLMNSPSWRLMLGVLSIPSLVYFALTVFYLPESPRWLVSKGRMVEANQVLQRLRGTTDVSARCNIFQAMIMPNDIFVSNIEIVRVDLARFLGPMIGELALLVEGLGTGGDTFIEGYIIGPANDLSGENQDTNSSIVDQIKIHGPEEGHSWIAKPIATGRSTILASRQGSLLGTSVPLVDPLVTLFGSVHEKHLENCTTGGSMLFLFKEHDQWDVENQEETHQKFSDGEDYESDDNLKSPLLSNSEKPFTDGSFFNTRRNSSIVIEGSNIAGEVLSSSTDIGGGWQLAWKWSEHVTEDGTKEEELQRVYLHQEGTAVSRAGSIVSVAAGETGETVQLAAALVGHSAIGSKASVVMGEKNGEGLAPPVIKAAEEVAKAASWRDLLEPGVKRALIVGIGLQVLQQIAGINGMLYYAPQILEQAGVAVLLSNMGMNSASASLFTSAITTFLMLPCIATSMWLMDIAGRRTLLLSTIPILIVSLLLLVLGNLVNLGSILNALISTSSVIVYLCCFVMAFGVIPNILCAEIFPTRVRGRCIALCALTYWIGNIIITYSFPVMLKGIGLTGVIGIYAVGCIISWIFVFLKVPETKGMPLEVISEFFALETTNLGDLATSR
ncbi:hypothetical protein TIFTF001_003972 [Ficus carica]|uniref:Major facilitator superfamily (MFS) profile domain-containing protein n=1 Tax=Ficus carica TaxID=3494 RepID=A0AA87ZW19_FICCA|nr:hypothetical protein TIFTF001_003972 [Ficus carica]